MTLTDFLYYCLEYYEIAPGIALENERLVSALKARAETEEIKRIFEEEF